ncbi:MAG TPA: MFS transporter [Accumulibacter sp.]|uniref:Inner membrane transport protein YajR n=2 Tax=Candidatus Accumulibacter TaxID=327159 RepID=A0A080MBE7_9PROT|nr:MULTISPECIES: MFS transporter [Candidatus Accumulibacter]KFB78291.1 MAG: Inner membrane transport protein YajR [Candidatus Accumulibacter cognatus]MCC2867392.1 MFS transporter [Candidatus Accumulibacter phosphatis]MCM8578283.1 MFS transporter [Accumulibacter sp.]MCQ1550410.1 MFS transporter [Candidatus Accumulibacter phosphatis]TMQ77298.1 putative transport protein [Candidatus Accumulibacter phosphatis]
MSTSHTDRMSSQEKRTGISLAAVFALRMLGLFLILPVFSIYAKELPSGNDMALVGIALGAYGLTQACLQIAFGAASDRFGRKPVIVFGLLLFVAGSFVAAAANDIYGIIAGRVLQGAGAISAAVTALAADLTREQHLTKVMAMIGSSIGLVFAISMVGAPLLYVLVGMPGIFVLTGILALLAVVVVLRVVPTAPKVPRQPVWQSFVEVLTNRQLLRLNFGVFALHMMLTAMWVLLPVKLISTGGLPVAEHWKVYLPALLVSFIIMVPAIILAERFARMKLIFNAAIVLLLAVQMGFGLLAGGLYGLAFWLMLFFVAFNILEATQPSLISRIAPPHAKGAALGVYNTTQSVGLFLGGLIGGILAKYAGAGAVWGAGAVLSFVWLLLGLTMSMPPPRTRPAPVPA